MLAFTTFATVNAAVAESFSAVLARWIVALDEEAGAADRRLDVPVAHVADGIPLKRGRSGDRVWLLSHRLMELGLLGGGDLTPEFDERVDAAVKTFQERNSLKPDGLVGRGTTAALNRTPRATAELLCQTAQQLRTVEAENLKDMVFVNLPSQTVVVVRDGEVRMTMRAIVGRSERKTPMIASDKITHVIVNPTWTVPPTVMEKDKLPNLRKNGTPGIKNATIYLDGEEVDPATVDWNTVTPNRVKIVQGPGDHNALGRFRFNLTNSFSIYLHSTNEPKLFDREIRTISSGCVRLQEARQLAEMLLGEKGIGPEQIDRLLATGTPQWVSLSRPLPVRFTYWMTTVGNEGQVRIHTDIYDREDEPNAARPTAAGPG